MYTSLQKLRFSTPRVQILDHRIDRLTGHCSKDFVRDIKFDPYASVFFWRESLGYDNHNVWGFLGGTLPFGNQRQQWKALHLSIFQPRLITGGYMKCLECNPQCLGPILCDYSHWLDTNRWQNYVVIVNPLLHCKSEIRVPGKRPSEPEFAFVSQ